MLSPELLKKVERLYIQTRRKVNDVFSGEYESAFRGRGIEFEEFREYIPGDDVRQIDWNVSARFDKPFVKIFKEERERSLVFLVDTSLSQNFGNQKSKRDLATEVAALLSYAAIQSNDKVGLILFSDQIELYIPPKKGRGHVWKIIASLFEHKPQGKGTDINQALRFLLAVTKRKATCFLVSDFLDRSVLDTASLVSKKHELVALRVRDTLEEMIPALALTDFEDLETGERVALDLHDQDFAELNLSADFAKRRIDFLDLKTDDDVVDALMKFFLKREKKR